MLAEKICERLGIPLLDTNRHQFPNGELSLSLSESVRGQDVYIIQSGAGDTLANDAVMELVILISACKMSSAKRVTAVIPFFPYSKQCKKKDRGTIPAKLVANMLLVAGVDHIMTVDLHASQLQGFFHVPVDGLFAEPTIAMYIQSNIKDYQNGVVVATKRFLFFFLFFSLFSLFSSFLATLLCFLFYQSRVTSLADKLSIDFALIQRVQHVRGQGTEYGPFFFFPFFFPPLFLASKPLKI
jgi:phosphoribosylpyrophosphate synthetase